MRTNAAHDGIAAPPGGHDGGAEDTGDALPFEKLPFQISNGFAIVILDFMRDADAAEASCCCSGRRGGPPL